MCDTGYRWSCVVKFASVWKMSMSSSSRRLEVAGTSTSPEHRQRSLGGRKQHRTQNVMRYTATILHPSASRPTWHFEVREFQITENPPIRMLPRQQPLVPESESIKYKVGGDNYNITASGPTTQPHDYKSRNGILVSAICSTGR